MNEKEKEQEQKYLEAVDVSYSYGLAKAMERIKSNPVLGFRTAGSRAEYETGEMLYCAFGTQRERNMSFSWGPIRPSF